MARVTATSCSWPSPGCPITSPSIRWEAARLVRTWDPPRSPLSPGKEQRVWRRCVENSFPSRSRSAASSVRWTGKGERPIPSTMTNKGGSRNIEQISYRAWQKRYGRSVGLRAPGMFIAMLRRTVASTGGTLIEVQTQRTKLSQFCHGCGQTCKKPLSQRWHVCGCGVGPIQRDLYSAFLAAHLESANDLPSCARYMLPWEGAEARLRAAQERLLQRAKEGQVLPRSMGMPRVRARQPQSLSQPTPEPIFLLRRGRVEAWNEGPEPPCLSQGSLQ
jgi:Putative transposase DNA-binding domain